MAVTQNVDLKVGFTCNNKCIHCVVSDKYKEKDLSLKEIEEILNVYISKYEKIALTLTGGEVTFRRDYRKILKIVKKYKTENKIEFVDIQTNARMLSKELNLKKSLEVVDFYLISLHSCKENTHDKVTRRQGSFAETSKAIEMISRNTSGRSLAIQLVLNKLNYKDIKETIEYCNDKFNVNEFNITFPHPIGEAYSKLVTPSYIESRIHINNAVEFCLSRNIKPFLEAIPMCIFKEKSRDYAIDFYSKRMFDVVGYGGEIDGFIDYSLATPDGYDKYNSCKKCELNECCMGVWKEHKRLYPDEDLIKLL